MNKRYEVGSKEFREVVNNIKSFSQEELNKLIDQDKVIFPLHEVAVYKQESTFTDAPLIRITLKASGQSVQYDYLRQTKGSYELKAIIVWGTTDLTNLALANISRTKEVLTFLNSGENIKILGADSPEDAIGFGLKDKSDFNNSKSSEETVSNYLLGKKELGELLLQDKVDLSHWELDDYFKDVKGRTDLLTVKEDPTWEEAREWILGLMRDLKLMYHPDDPPSVYIEMDTKKPTFNETEQKALKDSNDRLFEKFGEEVYRIGVEAQHQYEELRKNRVL